MRQIPGMGYLKKRTQNFLLLQLVRIMLNINCGMNEWDCGSGQNHFYMSIP